MKDLESSQTPEQPNPQGLGPATCSVELVWHRGPAMGGGGTAQDESPDGRPWWWDGDLLLVMVATNSGPFVRLVKVNADDEMLSFEDPDSGDDNFGYESRDIAWWARIERSLPQNAQAVAAASPETEPN